LPTCSLSKDRARAIPEILRVLSLTKELCQSSLHWIIESVADVPILDIRMLSSWFGGLPEWMCSSDFPWARRPRLYWCSWKINAEVGASWNCLEYFIRTRVKLPKFRRRHWGDDGWQCGANYLVMPTVSALSSLDRPNLPPSGVHHASKAALERWHFAGYASQVYSFEFCNKFETDLSCRAWGFQPKFYAEKSANTKERIELVHLYLAISEKNGSDVCLDLRLPFRPKMWPRIGLPPRTWHGRIIHGYPCKGPRVGHITQLQFQAAFNTLRWKIRNCLFPSGRFLHLVDSQPCAAILTKGRIGSERLRDMVH
jgi:hypothetical protein